MTTELNEIAEAVQTMFGVETTAVVEPVGGIPALYYGTVVVHYQIGSALLTVRSISSPTQIAVFNMAYLDDPQIPAGTIYEAIRIEGELVQ